ncbi:MAG: hypothetical protein BGO13_08665 [Burkholderiales bacterium 66-5]|nr:MAG: hypothetical protein BGO13_08665 [Burkholderiales bacterium 66-5]
MAQQQQADQFKTALEQSKSSAEQQAAQSAAQLGAMQQQFKLQEQSFNKANQKQPDLAGIDAKNRQAARTGQGGTLLTGPSGVKKDDLLLGKNTLLGA